MPNSFAYRGGEWKTTITSTRNWKIDETIPLPEGLIVEPKQGNSGTQVSITAKLNTKAEKRSIALVFVLADDPTTKEVVTL